MRCCESIVDPPPAFPDVALRRQHPVKALGAAFVVYECAGRLGKSACRKDDLCTGRCSILQVIDGDHVRLPAAGRTHRFGEPDPLGGSEGRPELRKGDAARQVGGVLKRLPEGSTLPWHRVVNRHGTISLTGPDLQRQRQALLAEGVMVSGSGQIDLQRYRWNY